MPQRQVNNNGPVIVVDTLNSLLEAEQSSIVRFLGPGSPYLSQATGKLRGEIQMLLEANQRRSAELAEKVIALGGEPAPRPLQPEEQYLAYLSIRFLLPKLVEAKQLLLDRYDNAIAQLDPATTPPDVMTLLSDHRAEHAVQLAQLKQSADAMLGTKS